MAHILPIIVKNYIVHGVKEDLHLLILEELIISTKTMRLKKIYFTLWRCHRLLSVSNLIHLIRPDEIYNLAAQSHVAVSFEVPEYTANADALVH